MAGRRTLTDSGASHLLQGHTAAPTALPSWCRSLVTSDRDVVNLGLMSISAVPLRLLRR